MCPDAAGTPPAASGSGSGSSSGGSGGTVRPNAAQTAAAAEPTTFTFSSKRSPFVHTSPPGAVTFVSSSRRGSDAHRDRGHRRQPGALTPHPDHNSDWISLRPLQPVSDVALPIFAAPRRDPTVAPGPDGTTAVFSGRLPPESRKSSARHPPRLSLVAQHHHATSPHPFFDSPPQLITPPPKDPFTQLARFDGYFAIPPSKPHRSRRDKKSQPPTPAPPQQLSAATLEQHDSKHRTPRASGSSRAASRAHTVKPSESQRPAPRTPSIFLNNPKPGPQPPPNVRYGKAALFSPQLLSQSQVTTPRQRSPKSNTPPDAKPTPSIATFGDCFGVLAATENVFPARPGSRSRMRSRSGSRGSENGAGSEPGSAGPSSEFQRRWTRRWLRRTMRGVGSMGSGSGSGSAGSAPGSAGGTGARSSGGNSGSLLRLAKDKGSGGSQTGSQDSLDRVRVSRSNAGSPSASLTGGQTPHGMSSVNLSDVDEGEVGDENESDSPEGGASGADERGREGEMDAMDSGSDMKDMMEELGNKDIPQVQTVAA